MPELTVHGITVSGGLWKGPPDGFSPSSAERKKGVRITMASCQGRDGTRRGIVSFSTAGKAGRLAEDARKAISSRQRPSSPVGLGWANQLEPQKRGKVSNSEPNILREPRAQGLPIHSSLADSSSSSLATAHFRRASRAGQSDWPHRVREYSTLGGTSG